ncbi:MAG: FAD-dependent oxidoreductase [Alphaproteobacteria bacterium]|nr:FAD-dependent oxidoreductase [Alphaproteobacteria bacterium]
MFALSAQELYSREGLVKLEAAFLDRLQSLDLALYNRLMAARAQPETLSDLQESEVILALAPQLEEFLALLFDIEPQVALLKARHARYHPVAYVKRNFVQRRAAKEYSASQTETFDLSELENDVEPLVGWPVDETYFAHKVKHLLDLVTPPDPPSPPLRVDPTGDDRPLESLAILARYAAWALQSQAGQIRHKNGTLFHQPAKLEPQNLVPVVTETINGVRRLALDTKHHHLRQRAGFALTDAGMDLEGALSEANYCIWCHHQGRDSCSTGSKEKPDAASRFKKSPLGVTLAGCPLDEKISEMNQLKAEGVPMGALAVALIDNPMLAATGHRICNDCMKSCIYQKQQPVDIPQIETRTLKDVLELPFGFEIYSLLTRWNPLNIRRPLPLPPSGYKVLVVGQGPAGYTLAHHLMNDGHQVVAIDGLKIEFLPQELSGRDAVSFDAALLTEPPKSPESANFGLIADSKTLFEELDQRVLAGFGGVAEYGITVRWDKNYLKVIRLLLERRAQYQLFGGVRFGGTLTTDQAFAMGFDHIALCLGAGRPTLLGLPNFLAKGVRQASDFLMGLQLTGAAKADSLANLQLRLPVVVIGGGLTAIDTATEALAYYRVQVEKFLSRYESLVATQGEAAVRQGWTVEDSEIAAEFIAHAKALRQERATAAREGRTANDIALLQKWGGATIIYRRRLVDAPSYTLNHEEVLKGLEEGIFFSENVSPVAVEIDEYGAAQGIRLAHDSDVGKIETVLPARAILVAAGTQPNTVLQREEPQNYTLDGKYFQAYRADGSKTAPERLAKPVAAEMIIHRHQDGRAVTFFGDLHPSFAGNVVKAMASAKNGYPVVTQILHERKPVLSVAQSQALSQQLNHDLRPRVVAVNRLTPTILEIIVKAPLAAQAFQPGQFFRLQNYETCAERVINGEVSTVLAMEGLALTGASADPAAGTVSMIILEMGGSSSLCEKLRPGEPVVLMGPTGSPTEIIAGETVLLVGGGLGNAVLFSIGRAIRDAGGKVLYFAGYKQAQDRYKIAEIERAADVVVWCCDQAPGFTPSRPQDKNYVGNIVEAMSDYGAGKLGETPIPLSAIQRVIAIGSDRMMAAVAAARHAALAPYLAQDAVAIGSINSPMQCMMKEICAQCLQRQVDPATGLEQIVFSCFNQDQPLDAVDWRCLSDRLAQNSLAEKLSRQYLRML